MKSILLLIIVAIVLTGIVYSPNLSYAQDESPVATPTVEAVPPDFELPETAEGTLPFIEEWLLFVAGLIATHVMAGVKKLPWFGKQEWFLKLVTELVSGISATVVAFVLGNAAVALGFLDTSGLWQVILFAWPAAVGIYHGKKLSHKVVAA